MNIETKRNNGGGGDTEKQKTNVGSFLTDNRKTISGFCIHCGAWKGELGLEPTPELYVEHLVQIFREVRRVLRTNGTCWLNLGDSFWGSGGTSGQSPEHFNFGKTRTERYYTVDGLTQGKKHIFYKPKDLLLIPHRVAIALQQDGMTDPKHFQKMESLINNIYNCYDSEENIPDKVRNVLERYGREMNDAHSGGWWVRSDIVWCLSGGAWVYVRTQKGEMPMMIKDMSRLKPETVQLWNGQKWTNVLGWKKSKRTGKEIELELRSGERISITPNHEFPTQRGLIRADQLKIGDAIDSCHLPEPETPKTPEHISDDAAWFVGLYLAEGSQSEGTIQIAGHIKETERWTRCQRFVKSYGGYLFKYEDGNRATININSKIILSLVENFVSGRIAKDKGLKVECWKYGNEFLEGILNGYLGGDAHWEEKNNRWRLGFTRNYNLEQALRTLCARLGYRIKLKQSTFPCFKGEIRKNLSNHLNIKNYNEIVDIRKARCRFVYDVAVEDEPHLFCLASGILTHNSKKNPMPESVTDRPSKAHEYIFLLTKSQKYYYDAEAIREEPTSGPSDLRKMLEQRDRIGGKTLSADDPLYKGNMNTNIGQKRGVGDPIAGRNKRSVWEVTTTPFSAKIQSSHWQRVLTGVVSDGMRRIVSLGCPVHGLKCHHDTNLFYGEHEADELNRKEYTYGYHDSKLQDDFFPIAPNSFEDFELQNLDYSRPLYVLSAIRHNSENHRMVRELSTSLPYISFSEILSHIGSRLKEQETFDLAVHMLLSNTLPDELNDFLLGQILYRNVDKSLFPSDCDCAIYEKIIKNIDHFATMPPKLVEPCILAGTSEHGVCAECGAPYERILEREKRNPSNGSRASGKSETELEKQYRRRESEHQIVPVDQPNLGSVDKIPRAESATKFDTETSTAGSLATYRQGARAYDAKYHTNEEGLFLNASERSITIQSEREESKIEAAELYPDDYAKQQWYINYVHEHGRVKQNRTIGWRKTCKCETTEVKPAIVLDPFFGAGTTGLVARKGNRDFLGIELNEKYITIAKKRLAAELEAKLL